MTVVIRGYREFDKATSLAGRDVHRETRAAFARVGDDVRDDGARLFSNYGTAGQRASHAASARRYRTKTRRRGVDVEQTLRKTTGLHPEYGSAQMRHGLVPALQRNEGKLRRETERAMDKVVDIFERRTI